MKAQPGPGPQRGRGPRRAGIRIVPRPMAADICKMTYLARREMTIARTSWPSGYGSRGQAPSHAREDGGEGRQFAVGRDQVGQPEPVLPRPEVVTDLGRAADEDRGHFPHLFRID